MTTAWASVFGGINDDWANYSIFNGNYLYVCGSTRSFDGERRPFVAKFNINEGDFEWCKIIKTTGGAYRLLIKDSRIIIWGTGFLANLL